MGKYSGILLASDFDGTLAASDGTIPERVRQAVAEFIAKGGRFTVSTGRTALGFHAYDAALINAPVILANGGMIYDYAAEKIVRSDGLDDTCIPDLRKVRDRFPNAAVEMYTIKEACCIHLSGRSRRHFAGQRIVWRGIDDPSEVEFPCVKIMFGAAPDEIQQIQKFMRENCPTLGFVPTPGEFLEVLRPGINKGSALCRLAETLGLEMRNVYAIGDSDNDLDMLKVASAAFVPKNGDDIAKACATYIVCSNNDGAVADAIEVIERIAAEL